MGFLSFDKTLNMPKGTVSLWFRIPQETVPAAGADTPAWNDFPVLQATIPLVVFGKQPQLRAVDWESVVIGIQNEGMVDEFELLGGIPHFRNAPAAPTYIGVNSGGGDLTLEINLQTADLPNCHQTTFEPIKYKETWLTYTVDGLTFTIIQKRETTFEDMSETDGAACERLGNAPIASRHVLPNTGWPAVSADHWHHVLLSWDLTSTSSHGVPISDERPPPFDPMTYVDTASKLYCALDDRDQVGENFPGICTQRDPHEIITATVYTFAGADFGPQPYPPSHAVDVHSGELGTGPCSVTTTFSNGVVADGVYIPSQVNYERSGQAALNPANYKIELAELQVFAGVVLDTSVVKNRRAFVDAKGKPVPAGQKADATHSSGSIELLGKQPDIWMHKTSNWKKGKNLGSGGDMKPTGTIRKYVPDPSLHGAQMPAKP